MLSAGKVGAKSLLIRRAAEKNSESMRGKTVEEHRRILQKLADIRPVPPGVRIKPVNLGGVPCEWITRKDSRPDSVIVYFHGGSWAFGNLHTARPVGVLLAELADYSVLVADYRLSPEHPYPAALEDCHNVYHHLLGAGYDPRRVVLFGDSAGGNLCLALLHLLGAQTAPYPAAVACASAVTDLRDDGPLSRAKPDLLYTIHENREQSIISLYLQGEDPGLPTISPVLGDMTGFPPLLLHVGEAESLRADNIAFAHAAARCRVRVCCKVWKEMFHDFTTVGVSLKESMLSLREIGAFFQAHTHSG